MIPRAPLSLDAAALAADRHWWGLGAEGRGVLASLWVAFATRGPIPDDPLAASRLALLDEAEVLRHWEEIAPFLRFSEGLIEVPALEAGMAAREKRSRAASVAARARHEKAGHSCDGTANAQRTHSERSKPVLSQSVALPSPGVSSSLVPSPTPPTSLMGLDSLESKEITTPGARVAPAVPESAPKPTRTPRPKAPPSTPPSYRDLFANPEQLEWFEKAVALRDEHIQRMPSDLRDSGGVAGHRPTPAATQFLARVKSGYSPRRLVACLRLYLEHDGHVQRGYVQGLEVFWGNPTNPKAKATFQAYLAQADSAIARSDARRAAGAAPPPSGPSLPSVSPALLAEAGLPVPPDPRS